jgi:nicotinate-nucleotide--dimethylbenzimidazole phosphoribosyltransferase
MGIANTTSAATIMHVLTGIILEDCVGAGTGLNKQRIEHKKNIIRKSIEKHEIDPEDPLAVLSTFGGFEIAMITGAMLQAAQLKMVVLVDGFIATAALLVAYKLYPEILDYCIFCHTSDEKGHKNLCEWIGARPLLHLNMRLGEGTGCALALPLIQSALSFLKQMASFEDAGVSNK